MTKMTQTRLNEIGARFRYRLACWQGYCPTEKEQRNPDVKSLATRLKGQNYEETLANILEWQDRNMSFWTERHPLSTIFNYFPIGMLFAFMVGLIPTAILSIYLKTNFVIWFCALSLTVLLTGTILILTITMLIIRSNRKIPVLRGLTNAFSSSMPIDALLQNRLGVCRDYAKMTACLLLNIYCSSDMRIYFAHAPNHVATGIALDNRLYMLDQRLPILTIEKWNCHRRLRGKLEKVENNRLIAVEPKVFLSKTDLTPINKSSLVSLAQTMMESLNINPKEQEGSNPVVRVRWRKGMILYQDENLVNSSLTRWLQARMSMELIKTSNISRIEAISEKDDILFLIHCSLKN